MNNAIKKINTTIDINNVIDICWNNYQNRYDSIAFTKYKKILTRRKMNKILINTIGWKSILKPYKI